MTDANGPSPATAGDITLGISIEPLASIQTQLAALQSEQQQSTTTAAKPPPDTKALAQRIIENAFNFLASFGSDTVPLRAFEEWWRKFERRVERDPGFLERA